MVRQIPTMMVSFQRVSGVPSAEMMKLANAEITRPNGRMVIANERMATETNSGPRHEYAARWLPSDTMPTTITAKPNPSNRPANIRGAVPAPNEKPCMPCRSLEAQNANSAIAISAMPPTKSCGPRTQFGMIDRPNPWLGVSLIDISRIRLFCSDGIAIQTILPTDFLYTTPAKPKTPPASNSQSGFSRVAKASAAAVAVTSPAAKVRSEATARINPLAPISPIESGTSAACTMAGQADRLDLVSNRLTP